MAPNLTCSKYQMLIQYNTTQQLIATTGLNQWHYGHAVIVTAVWGSIPPAHQVFNDQPTMLKVPFGGVSQHMGDVDSHAILAAGQLQIAKGQIASLNFYP